jgi:hypothetical protein
MDKVQNKPNSSVHLSFITHKRLHKLPYATELDVPETSFNNRLFTLPRMVKMSDKDILIGKSTFLLGS